MSEPGDRIGQVLGGAYRLERVLGEGGMGTVYEASHLRVPRRFAVKLLNQEVVNNRDVFERFRREADIAGSLGSEHIVQVFDFNHAEDGAPYMVLELLEGEDLSRRVKRAGRLTVKQCGAILDQITNALEAAHKAGIVHRDLKPANIFLTRKGDREDFVKVLDFGISKVLGSQTMATRTGAVFGTPNYMSPEQADGRQSEIDHRTDLFAVGAILYECLTGKIAFDAPTLSGTIFQVCYGAPPPLRSYAPEVSDRIARVIDRALSKSRDDRYASATALRDDFVGAASGQAAQAPVAGDTIVAPQPPAMTAVAHQTTLSAASSEAVRQLSGSPRRRAAVPVLVGGALLAAAVAWWTLRDRPAVQRAPTAVATPVGPPTAVAPRPALTPAPEAPTVSIRLRLDPPDARVELDGIATTENPLRLPRGEVHKLVLSAPGHVSVEREIRPLVDGELEVKLLTESTSKTRREPSREKKKKVDWQEW